MDRAVVVGANLKNAVLQRAVFTRSDLTGAVVEARCACARARARALSLPATHATPRVRRRITPPILLLTLLPSPKTRT